MGVERDGGYVNYADPVKPARRVSGKMVVRIIMIAVFIGLMGFAVVKLGPAVLANMEARNSASYPPPAREAVIGLWRVVSAEPIDEVSDASGSAADAVSDAEKYIGNGRYVSFREDGTYVDYWNDADGAEAGRVEGKWGDAGTHAVITVMLGKGESKIDATVEGDVLRLDSLDDPESGYVRMSYTCERVGEG